MSVSYSLDNLLLDDPLIDDSLLGPVVRMRWMSNLFRLAILEEADLLRTAAGEYTEHDAEIRRLRRSSMAPEAGRYYPVEGRSNRIFKRILPEQARQIVELWRARQPIPSRPDPDDYEADDTQADYFEADYDLNIDDTPDSTAPKGDDDWTDSAEGSPALSAVERPPLIPSSPHQSRTGVARRSPQEQGKHARHVEHSIERPASSHHCTRSATRVGQAVAPRSPNRLEARRTDRRRRGARRPTRRRRGVAHRVPRPGPGDRFADRFVIGASRRRTEYVSYLDGAAARPPRAET